MSFAGGRHFLQIPGPTNVPAQVLRAMATPTIDHHGPEFAQLARDVLDEIKPVSGTSDPVVLAGVPIDPAGITAALDHLQAA